MPVRLVWDQEASVACLTFAAGVGLNAAAWSVDLPLWSVVFYHLLFALGCCIAFPTWYHAIFLGRPLASMGLSWRGWPRNAAIGLLLAAVTVPWRLAGLIRPGLAAFVCLMVAMVFSTLFEEIFFRGFLQSALVRSCGVVPAIALSGLAFALYHMGYDPYYRRPDVIAGLTFVGMLFACGFQLTRNVVTSFVLNLPHAIVTFLTPGRDLSFATRQHFFDPTAGLVTLVALGFAASWLVYVGRRAP